MKRSLVLFALLASCAHAPIDRDPESAREELLRAEAALNARMAEARVDCERAGRLRDNVCLLSERICALTSANDDRCADGRARCQKARARVEAVCPKRPL